jgi:hypothetical protein
MSPNDMVATNLDLSGGEDGTKTKASANNDNDNDNDNNNVAQCLLDLHNSKSTFDFCGGMTFQLALSEWLKGHLQEMAASKNSNDGGVVVSDATKMRVCQVPNCAKDASTDNVSIFHGREIRKVADAAGGGMGMVLQLSLANGNDPKGCLSMNQHKWGTIDAKI